MTCQLQESIAEPSAPHTSVPTSGSDTLIEGDNETRFEAIGAPWTIDAPRPLDPAVIEHVRARIEEFDATYSRFRPDSLVSQVAADQLAGPVAFPEDAPILFDLYDRLHRLTGGAVDPLVGQQLELLGYDPGYSLTPAPEHVLEAAHADRPVWDRDARHDGAALTMTRPVVVDVGAAGKGHLVDIVTDLLTNAGVTDVVVDASGDLRHVGDRPTRIGLEHPHRPGAVVGVVEIEQRALCASATTRRAWGDRLHHVLDARTGGPTHEVVATWVVAETAAVADGLATALFFTDPRELSAEFDFQYVRLSAAGHLDASNHLDGEVFRPYFAPHPHRPPQEPRMTCSTRAPRTWPLSAGLAAVLSLGACSAGADGESDQRVSQPSATAPSTGRTSTTPESSTDGRYRDGTYIADGWYGGLPSRIGVSLTISDNTITDVDISTPATDDTSLDYQRRFADAAPAAVVGKSLDEVQLDRLAGASGCSEGFNNALDLIRRQAAPD